MYREKAASALKSIVGVAAVDCDAHGSIAQQYGVKGFPTIKFFSADASGKLKAIDYQGGRTAKEIVQWAGQQAQKVALGRLGVKSSGGSGSSSSNGGSSGGDGFYDGTDVFTLDDGNFHSQVVSSDEMWFIEFYAPWCGHCKNLKPTWIELASSLEGKVKVGAVDCTANQATCSEFGIQGFPTIKFFGTNKDRPEAYEGARDLGAFVAYGTDKWQREQPPPEVRELTDETVWEEHCVGHEANAALDLKAVKPKQLCLVAFLPHILDSKVEGRNGYLTMLKDLALLYKDRPFAWFWAEGGAQSALEANVGVGYVVLRTPELLFIVLNLNHVFTYLSIVVCSGYGYPAFIALNPSKAKYATLRSAFQPASLKEFMDAVRTGHERVADLEGSLAKIEERGAWDGQDAAESVEEEFSLEDLGLGGGDGEL